MHGFGQAEAGVLRGVCCSAGCRFLRGALATVRTEESAPIEISFTAFMSRKKSEHITGRLVVRRIPELNKKNLDQPTLFDTHRFHAFFTTSTLDTVTADKTHRAHAGIELVNADLKNSALAHLPSVSSPPTPPGSFSP